MASRRGKGVVFGTGGAVVGTPCGLVELDDTVVGTPCGFVELDGAVVNAAGTVVDGCEPGKFELEVALDETGVLVNVGDSVTLGIFCKIVRVDMAEPETEIALAKAGWMSSGKPCIKTSNVSVY